MTGLVLGYNITHIDAMHSQGTDLIQWSTETLTKLVSDIVCEFVCVFACMCATIFHSQVSSQLSSSMSMIYHI